MEEQKNPASAAPAVQAASAPVSPAPAAPAVSAPAVPTHISYDDFAKVEIRAGKIVSAEKIANADKLLRLMVDFAEAAPRQIVSGISMYFADPSVLVGKSAMFVTNLEPRKIRGFESNGMLFAVSAEIPSGVAEMPPSHVFSLLEPSTEIPAGTRAK